MVWGFMGIFKRALQFPNGEMVGVSPPGTARLRYNNTSGDMEVSLNGAAYTAFGDPGDFDIPDNDATAFRVHQGANDYFVISTVNGSEAMTFGTAAIAPAMTFTSRAYLFNLADNLTTAFVLSESGSDYIRASTQNGNEALVFGESGALGLIYQFELKDNTTGLSLVEGANSYYVVDTGNGTEGHAWSGANGAFFSFAIKDNTAATWRITQGADIYLAISTANAAESISIGPAAIMPAVSIFTRDLDITLLDNTAGVMSIVEGANNYLQISTANAAETMVFGNATTNPSMQFLGTGAKLVSGHLSIGEIAGDPAAVANRNLLYVKDVAGFSELFSRDDAGNILQMTSQGQLAATSIPVVDNTATAFRVHEAANDHILLNTTNGAEILTLGAAVATTSVRIANAAGNLGFYGNAGAAKQTVTGSKGANAALTSLMAALVAIGLFTDTTS